MFPKDTFVILPLFHNQLLLVRILSTCIDMWVITDSSYGNSRKIEVFETLYCSQVFQPDSTVQVPYELNFFLALMSFHGKKVRCIIVNSCGYCKVPYPF